MVGVIPETLGDFAPRFVLLTQVLTRDIEKGLLLSFKPLNQSSNQNTTTIVVWLLHLMCISVDAGQGKSMQLLTCASKVLHWAGPMH